MRLTAQAAAFRYYTMAAAQGRPYAEYALGCLYEHGKGVPKDDAQAVRWFRAAAERGHVAAKLKLLSVSYLDGRSVSQNTGEGTHLCRRAAEHPAHTISPRFCVYYGAYVVATHMD